MDNMKLKVAHTIWPPLESRRMQKIRERQKMQGH
jgi:hypothetical protein